MFLKYYVKYRRVFENLHFSYSDPTEKFKKKKRAYQHKCLLFHSCINAQRQYVCIYLE